MLIILCYVKVKLSTSDGSTRTPELIFFNIFYFDLNVLQLLLNRI